jgi:hypothetical protein
VALGSGPFDLVGCAEPGNAATDNDDPFHNLVSWSVSPIVL